MSWMTRHFMTRPIFPFRPAREISITVADAGSVGCGSGFTERGSCTWRWHRHTHRVEYPQAADQDRRQADHRTHHRRDAAVAADRPDPGDDGARLSGRDPSDRPAGRV